MRHLGFAIVLAMGATAACDPPQPRVAPWVAPAADAPPGPEAMYLEMNQGDMKTADALLQDLWPARGYPDAKLAWPLTWKEDPYKDAYFRFMFYSLRHTEHLLWAYQTTHDRRYLDKLIGVLDSYVAYDATRAPDVDSFDNAHAASYRAMVLTNVYFKLQQFGELSPTLQTGIRDSLQRLGVFLVLTKSFEGHANHGFTEAAALLVVAHNFPDLDGAASWRAMGIERLEQMRVTNIDADGVDIENSPFHHLLVLGLVAQIGNWSAQYEPAISEQLTVASVRGTSNRMQGWVSEVYGKKIAADAVEYNRHSKNASFATLIATGARAALGKPPTIRQSIDAGTGERTIGVCAYGADNTIRISREGAPEASVIVIGGGGC